LVDENELRVLILAGGGGHTGYARILAEALSGKAQLLFLAPDDEPISVQRLAPFGEVDTLTKPRHPTTPLWRFALRFIKAFLQSLRRFPPDVDVVVSTGSNFSVPPAIVAWLRGVPIINLESRVKLLKASGAARFIGHLSKLTALQWEEQAKFHRGTVFGPILPKRTINPWDGGYILITGGTYGYKELFDAAILTGLKNVILQTGMIDPTKYVALRPEWRVLTFTDKFNELVAGAQVVVTPPGGTPIEAVAYGKPVVIVPYPGWARAADKEETIQFALKIRATLLDCINPSNLEEAIEMSKRIKPIMLNDGTEKLAEAILNIAHTYGR
jgi:UDP-N-acetylglucosamine--N-acetylmuramyl-(pentapeptide) pyrophosphoryl-undecaprenol N-acetylglucosamine transferase